MEVLEVLRRTRTASAEEIAAQLGITANAVRQHLANLERQGLVNSEPLRHKRGRPMLRFSLTERATAVFPKRYGQLASMVLTELQELGGSELLEEIFKRAAMRRADVIEPEIEKLGFDEKLRRVVAWIARAGTLPETEQTEQGVKISIHNCPFRNTALKFPQVCTITPQLLLRLLDAPVSQVSSIHRRDPYCSFVVQRPHPQPQ